MNRIRTLKRVLSDWLFTLFLAMLSGYFFRSRSPILEVDVTELDFGEADTSKTFVITNGGDGTLEWLLSEEEDWLTTDVTSGMLEAGLSATVTVEVDRSKAVSAGFIYQFINGYRT